MSACWRIARSRHSSSASCSALCLSDARSDSCSPGSTGTFRASGSAPAVSTAAVLHAVACFSIAGSTRGLVYRPWSELWGTPPGVAPASRPSRSVRGGTWGSDARTTLTGMLTLLPIIHNSLSAGLGVPRPAPTWRSNSLPHTGRCRPA
jgi:hypothetical protein